MSMVLLSASVERIVLKNSMYAAVVEYQLVFPPENCGQLIKIPRACSVIGSFKTNNVAFIVCER